MSEKTRPKFSFSRKPGGGEFLNVEAEVVSVQLRRFISDWKTLGRVTLYRTKDGVYSELPERTPTSAPG